MAAFIPERAQKGAGRMDDHRSVYREEAFELLAELEAALLELENTPEDLELVGQVFRSMHTIKGSGAMFGFDDIAAFTHEIETVFDLVRDGRMSVDRDLIQTTLQACDLIRQMVNGDPVDEDEERRIVRRFIEMAPGGAPSAARPSEGQDRPASGEEVLYRIRFRPEPHLFRSGANPMLLLDELRGMGECEAAAIQRGVPPLADLDPEACYLSWDILLQTGAGMNALKDVFIFVADQCELDIRPLELGEEGQRRRIGDILVERGDIRPEELEKFLKGQKRVGEILVDANAVDRDTLASALLEQQRVQDARRRRHADATTSSIRVAAEKLDALVDRVGELVTVQARLTRKASIADDGELTVIAEEVERLSADLRDNAMNIRMLPVGNTFRRFRRLVHDLGLELGKEVTVVTEGEETELDKTVLEQLGDPLIHIIRNAMDHDIEPPDVREAAGKPRQGTLTLAAEHSGPDVIIRISGDGAGMDLGAIRARAVEGGLVAEDAELDRRELCNLIFTPGFSTAKSVSGVSGRGVGMDVVKRRVESLRGSVELDSRTGRGTTVTLRLPLTLAISDGLLIQVGGDHYILPLLAVEECLEIDRAAADRAQSRNVLEVRGEFVSYMGLRELFGADGTPPEIQKVVVMKAGGQLVGLGVDHVVGQHQTVIKSLGRLYRDVKAMSGATILGDGTVALILDVDRIVEAARGDGAAAR
jgi:two-component system chemotaxis sensor kinase CheA